MNAVAIPIDLARIRGAVDRLDLPAIDLRNLDRSDLGDLRHDIVRMVGDTDLQKDLQRLMGDLDLPALPAIDLPDLDDLFGRRKPGLLSGGSIVVGGLALLGGIAMGGLIAFFLHPSKGQKRRRQLRRRLGRVKRRLLG